MANKLEMLHVFEISGRHRGFSWRENNFTCSLPIRKRIGNANSGTWRDQQPHTFPPFASRTTCIDFDAFRSPLAVNALACRSARATNIKAPVILRIGPRGMVKDLDVIKFDSFAWNVLLGALKLQSGHSESTTNQVLKSTHAYLNSIRMESLFRML
jgi:hypothetical protein